MVKDNKILKTFTIFGMVLGFKKSENLYYFKHKEKIMLTNNNLYKFSFFLFFKLLYILLIQIILLIFSFHVTHLKKNDPSYYSGLFTLFIIILFITEKLLKILNLYV